MESSAIGIIGGADGPTAVFYGSTVQGLLIMAAAIFVVSLALGFVAGYVYKRHKERRKQDQ